MVLAEVTNTVDHEVDAPASAAKRRAANTRKSGGCRQSKIISKRTFTNSPNATPAEAATKTTVASQTEQGHLDETEALEKLLHKSEEEANNYKELLTHICNIIRQSEPVESPASEESEVLSSDEIVHQLKQLLFVSPRTSLQEFNLSFDVSGIFDEQQDEEGEPNPSFTRTPLDSLSPNDDVSGNPTELKSARLSASSCRSSQPDSAGKIEKLDDSLDQSTSMSMSTASPKVKKRGRRQTMAIVRDRVLLNTEDQEETERTETGSEVESTSSSTISMMDTASSDEIYLRSTCSNELSIEPFTTEPIAIRSTKEKQSKSNEEHNSQTTDTAIEQLSTNTMSSNGTVHVENKKVEVSTGSNKSSLKQVSKKRVSANVASPSQKKTLRRSGRRKTMALHKGTLLLAHEGPDSFSPVTPNIEQSPVPSSLKQQGIEFTISNTTAIGEDDAPIDTKKECTPVRSGTTASVYSLSQSGSGLRRSRRNSIMPGKYRDERVLVGYHPNPRTTVSAVSTKSERLTENDVDNYAESSLKSDPGANNSNSMVHQSMTSNDKSNENETAFSRVDHAIEESKRLGIGTETVTSTEKHGLNSMSTQSRGLPPLPPATGRADQPSSNINTDSCAPKIKKKRRKSVGMHFKKGGRVTSKEIDGLHQESMSLASRKRSRRGQIRENEQKDVDSVSSSSARNPEMSNEVVVDSQGFPSSTKDENGDHETIMTADLVIAKSLGENAKNARDRTLRDVNYIKSKPTDTAKMEVVEEVLVEAVKSNVLPDISASEISACMDNLFPGKDTVSQPCVSARIFACYSLAAEKTADSPAKARTRTRRYRSCRHVQLLSPLLNCIVQAELSSIGTYDDPKSASKTKKRVQFCSVDGSSTRPPVDSVAGSNIPFEESIRALHDAVREARGLCTPKSFQNGKEETHAIKRQLKSLLSFLRDFEKSSGTHLLKSCAMSMPNYWPPQRFANVAKIYRADFACILTALAEYQQIGFDGNSLILEQRLADYIGRSIRYYLRKFFNPPPLPLTTDEEVDTSVRSNIHECLVLTVADGTSRDTAAADGSVSSVFSAAVRYIYNYFGVELLSSDEITIDTQRGFCRSRASVRGLGPKRSDPITLSEADAQEILSDIHDAQAFVAVARSCKFLMDLLQWPGVKEEVQRVGGWSNVEHFGGMIQEFDLKRACEDDAYFVLLRDIEILEQKVIFCWTAMEPLLADCEVSLAELWSKFRCGTRKKSLLLQNPCIESLAAALKEGKQDMFPSLSEPSDDE